LYELSPAQNEIVRYVADNYLTMGMTELMNDVVYLTEPMKQGRKGALLPMKVADNAVKDEIGFGLEDLLRAKEEAAAGVGAASL
jgi:hypothetical protein